ncbi:ImmA/IrrE family metallo-endopeptidase [Candidatus Peregrinibacteria bacterium]|jgi:Zn-dependent peptidase ImmA (M78 family)|nr:ImmA/IrrE family metallo-endopeptidase [Candidatus Peregrinibacteria bacterium]MBT3598633.1 ImmA/IrrE family metallo-endopeptidase [Candidatus Peregrinibacteria bacterium]MBT4367254.1 ImmA/IrrE family metallo-endopeptidase [Candidatus Peregrinibacteria bacterium]MBT6730968.1 ImmA/IrrE family metallo-endopeptidase [Candidatus Peregrinibacteria bacterium]MBT7009891.1 ImmA/IrrE family metallo-endopeptidase [Candidatus Peregrinibacteria bacterium]
MNTLLSTERLTEIKNEANTTLKEHGHVKNPFERISSIADANGIELLEADLYDISGALRKEGGSWKIYVNKQDSEQRKLFTVAHELGHYFIHKDERNEFIDGQFIARDETMKYMEQELEANEFAGNLIMPEQEVRNSIATDQITTKTIQDMARQFGVSTFAMDTRLRNLGYDTTANSEQQSAA